MHEQGRLGCMNLDRELSVLLERDYRRGRAGFGLSEDEEVDRSNPLKSKLAEGILGFRCLDLELTERLVPTPAEVRARFYIPKGVETVSHKTPTGLYIVSWEQHGKVFGVGFSGNRKKPDWFYNFGPVSGRGPAALQRRIKDTIESFKSSVNRKEARRKEVASFQHSYEVGDILYSSWGYDQTNVDFYEVVGTTTKSIKIREIATKVTSNGIGSDSVMPLKGKFIGKAMTKRVRPGSDGRGSVKLTSFSSAYPWDGRPKHQTAAGYGH